MSKIKFVRVEWEDSSSMNRIWNTPDDYAKQKNSQCTSIGYLVHEDETCVVVASHKGEGDFGGGMRIPKRAIIKRKTVREPR